MVRSAAFQSVGSCRAATAASTSSSSVLAAATAVPWNPLRLGGGVGNGLAAVVASDADGDRSSPIGKERSTVPPGVVCSL